MQMQFYEILPPLKPYIKVICTMECNEDADTSHIRVLPDTCVEIFVNYTITPVAIIGQELYKRSIVTFRMNQPMDVQMRKGAGCVAICFYPGRAYNFFQIPMHELSNTTTLLSDLWKAKTNKLEDILADLENNEARVAVLQNYLLKLLAGSKDNLQIQHCLSLTQLLDGLMPLERFASETGLGQRQLSRKFQQHVGLSPGEYLRVNRFINSLKYLKTQQFRSLTEVAFQCGYYDQAHFIRDYKNYTGHTPGEVMRSENILY